MITYRYVHMECSFTESNQAVNDLDFHPGSAILVSCGKDSTIKFYDYSQSTMKRSFRHIQDSHNVRSVHFHPSGDFLLAGTDFHMIKLYDVNTLQCYVSGKPQENHTAPINQVRYSAQGNLYASCAKDGAVKLWDTVTNTVISSIPKAHNGFEVRQLFTLHIHHLYQPTTVAFSKNGKYLLTAGKDGTIKIWELSTGRQMQHIVAGPQWV